MFAFFGIWVAELKGLEPSTYGVTGRRSNQAELQLRNRIVIIRIFSRLARVSAKHPQTRYPHGILRPPQYPKPSFAYRAKSSWYFSIAP